MQSTQPTAGSTAAQPLARGYVWTPTMDLQPGMVVAKPVIGRSGARATMFLAAGASITVDTIAQLVIKGVECVAVEQGEYPDAAAHVDAARHFEARLREIFGPAPDAHCRKLLEVLLAYGID